MFLGEGSHFLRPVAVEMEFLNTGISQRYELF
jgi:hypothetical protein